MRYYLQIRRLHPNIKIMAEDFPITCEITQNWTVEKNTENVFMLKIARIQAEIKWPKVV